MTVRGLSLLESVIGSESGHHVEVCGNEILRVSPGISDRVSMRAIVFIRTAVLPTLSGAL
jgi:hypothetical protein